MENKLVKTEKQLAIENAQKDIVNALQVLSVDKVSNAKESIFAINSLKQIDGESNLLIAKHLAKVKNNEWYKQEIDYTIPKPDFYKTFGKWAKDNCDIERAQADNLVQVASLVDDNGKDIFAKAENDKGYYNSTQLLAIWRAVKTNIKDEKTDFAKRLEKIKELAENGVIYTHLSVNKLKEKIKEYYKLDDMQDITKDIKAESKAESKTASESKAESKTASESKAESKTASESKAESVKAEKIQLTEKERALILAFVRDNNEKLAEKLAKII